MGRASRDRIRPHRGRYTQWTGQPGGGDGITTATGSTTGLRVLDMGTVEQGANSEAKVLSLDMPNEFDDTIHSEIRLWCANIPDFTEHVWRAALERDRNVPATLTTAMSNDADLPTNPYSAIKATANGAASADPDVYNAVAKRIQQMHLQLQVGNAGLIYEQKESPFSAPILFLEAHRLPNDQNQLGLNPRNPAFDRVTGHMFTFTDVGVFLVDTVNGIERWRLLGEVKDESVNLTTSEEHITWEADKPLVRYQIARASFEDGIVFRMDGMNPEVWGKSWHSEPYHNPTTREVYVDHSAEDSDVIEGKIVVRWRTRGGYLCTGTIERGVAMRGDFTPGEQDFSGAEVTVQGLADDDALVMRIAISDTPVTYSPIPLIYKTIAAAS